MNENIDLTKILKDCPEGTEFWSDNYGEVKFLCIEKDYDEPILVEVNDRRTEYYTKEGWWSKDFPASCLLWSSKDCRDWSKFTAPWYKKEKFDPKTLQQYDKVIERDSNDDVWECSLFSHIREHENFPYRCVGNAFVYCIPYNDDTKHLVGTNDEAPEYYEYWED